MANITTALEGFFSDYDFGLEFWGNTVGQYATALVLFIGLGIVFKLIQWLVLQRLAALAKKTETDIDDTLIRIVKSLRPGFYLFVAFFFAVQSLTFSEIGTTVLKGILLAWVAYQIVIALQILIDYVIDKKFTDLDGDGEPDNGIVSFMSGLAKGALWIVAALMVLSNLGVNVTGLMAGLGIGGLAIAFALQGIFADLFASFAIYLDKPFKVGDHIVAGDKRGVVEKIGIKSTRIRALQGEEIIMSNQELTSATVHNYKRLAERRITTQFGLTYDTPKEKLEQVPDIIKKIVDEEKMTRFDRVYFTTFGDSALLFDLVYYIESDNYEEYLKAQQTMNFKIIEAFERLGVEMAFPTQTIYLQKG
jgi:small-conductance mechanosensitive channel